MSASVEQTRDFLERFKRLASTSSSVLYLRRDLDRKIAELGLSRVFAVEIVFCLTEANYCSGPEPDEGGRPGEVWVFGFDCGDEIYLKLYLDEPAMKAYCFSFHRAEYPLRYPHRSGA